MSAILKNAGTGGRPDDLLASAFGDYASRWAAEQGASSQLVDLVRQTASLLSKATSAGHVCVHLRDICDGLVAAVGDDGLRVNALRDALLESQIVGTPATRGSLPLILDTADRLYLHRYFDYEARLAATLARRRRLVAANQAALPERVLELLHRLFEHNQRTRPGEADWQKIAVITALLGNLTVISGGPGTGKTTAIVNLLACLIEEDPECRIALAAPTGKAAARIADTLRQRAAHLPEHIKRQLPEEASTVHRLLGRSRNGGFAHHAGNPLPIDVLVVDEASMLDLALATHLFEAVPDSARIILVGDKDQLAAVESGAVFAELSVNPVSSAERVRFLAEVCGIDAAALQLPGLFPQPLACHGLRDSVVWLSQNYRFASDSGIGLFAAEINAGDANAALARLRDRTGADASLCWLDEGASQPSSAAAEVMFAGYAGYLAALKASADEPQVVMQAFERFRILCAMHEGGRGARLMNELIGSKVRRELRHPLDPGSRSEWYPGRPVIVLRNDYVLRLFNGDVGITLPDAAGNLAVYFPDQQGSIRAVAPLRLPEHETAFALTIHKAQGSEFDEAVVVLPANANQILTRELLYTGVTRARERVTVLGGADVLEITVRAATQRLSGLLSRLQEIG